jgi:hypothetical protein
VRIACVSVVHVPFANAEPILSSRFVSNPLVTPGGSLPQRQPLARGDLASVTA